MRIRTKLLLVLLALAVPPLVGVCFYAVYEGRLLGHELAARAADAYRRAAEQELALMVDLIGEDLNDNRRMMELSLALLGQEARTALTSPPLAGTAPAAGAAFDAADGVPQGLATLPDYPVPATAAAMSLSLPGGSGARMQPEPAARLALLAPTMRVLRRKLAENMLWAYVALPDGLMVSYPGHGRMPDDYDPRTRPWYTTALARKETSWSILVDASTGRLTATVSGPVCDAAGKLLGVAAIDAPFEAMLPESDLSRRWGKGVKALLVHAAPGDSGHMVVIGSQSFLDAAQSWKTTPTPEPFASADPGDAVRLARAIVSKKPDQLSMQMGGQAYFAVFKPFPDTPAGLLVLVPREAVLRQADSAEAAILARTHGMIAVVVGVSLLAVAGAVILAGFGARAVTRPVMALCAAAGKLAQGDLACRAPVTSRDELADLAKTFNEMAPKLAERLRLKQDMLLAMEVQQNLLPAAPPRLPGLSIAGSTRFCDETGGDYFDFLKMTDDGAGGLDVIVGDATGHGIAAALFMATGRALLRGGRAAKADPAALLTLANGLLCEDTMDSGRFLTLFALRLVHGGLAPDGHLEWARAGHDPALVYDPATDAFVELFGPGLPLGVLPDFVYEGQSHPGLKPGQVLALGTDGIWEARNPAGEMYGKDRFRAVLRANAAASAEEILAAGHQDVADFQAGAPRDDDITLVILKAEPA
ncbi:SpoIIE family protein phosphatase [Solidesulfovibrio sp.]|uniref:SpoIIE family protein phosphatase n=1 Tax=Solidesulfovibrio sp. TaxID=2910990 RepID=UPI002B20034A|nr:SpoIIE family protein phosphatase [Solidesulfovibrio sp.]MEA5088269.1 SpoIIE family protein phosphatase [Solidesulfovibrio sp.]